MPNDLANVIITTRELLYLDAAMSKIPPERIPAPYRLTFIQNQRRITQKAEDAREDMKGLVRIHAKPDDKGRIYPVDEKGQPIQGSEPFVKDAKAYTEAVKELMKQEVELHVRLLPGDLIEQWGEGIPGRGQEQAQPPIHQSVLSALLPILDVEEVEE